jgi:predicted dehydrogenase
MAARVEDAERMIERSRASGAVLQIGHVERFNPAVQALRERHLEPLFVEVHRLTPFTFRATDVSVVLDLMIHDLDLLLELVGAPVTSIDASGGAIFTRAEDVVSARLRFANGAVANVTASRVSLNPMRRFRIFSRDSYFSLDLAARQGLHVTRGPRWDERGTDLRSLEPDVAADRQRMMDFVFKGLLKVEEFHFEEREPLKEEIRAFIHSARTGEAPLVSGEKGLQALELALAVVRSVAENRPSSTEPGTDE